MNPPPSKSNFTNSHLNIWGGFFFPFTIASLKYSLILHGSLFRWDYYRRRNDEPIRGEKWKAILPLSGSGFLMSTWIEQEKSMEFLKYTRCQFNGNIGYFRLFRGRAPTKRDIRTAKKWLHYVPKKDINPYHIYAEAFLFWPKRNHFLWYRERWFFPAIIIW